MKKLEDNTWYTVKYKGEKDYVRALVFSGKNYLERGVQGLNYIDRWTNAFNLRNSVNSPNRVIKKASDKYVLKRLTKEAKERGLVSGCRADASTRAWENVKLTGEYSVTRYKDVFALGLGNGCIFDTQDGWATVTSPPEEKVLRVTLKDIAEKFEVNKVEIVG